MTANVLCAYVGRMPNKLRRGGTSPTRRVGAGTTVLKAAINSQGNTSQAIQRPLDASVDCWRVALPSALHS